MTPLTPDVDKSEVNRNLNPNMLTNSMREEIERWHLQAKEELSTAHICSKGKKWFAVAFWCQQAAEKALKAVFMLQKRRECN